MKRTDETDAEGLGGGEMDHHDCGNFLGRIIEHPLRSVVTEQL